MNILTYQFSINSLFHPIFSPKVVNTHQNTPKI
nr:MAG TPA: hypothetical protein [Caudoviricetes sp.]